MDQIEEVRAKIDIVQLISEYLPLQKSGRNFKALCPFHAEKVPSFMVSPERQIFKCFGCFPAGELIKTKIGPKPIEEICKGDEVFTHQSRWQRVIRLLERDYNGDFVSIRIRKLGGVVTLTGDHKIFTVRTKQCGRKGRETRLCQTRCQQECSLKYFLDYKIEEVEARVLSQGDYLLYPVDKSTNNIKQIDLQNYLTKPSPKHGANPREINYQIKIEEDFLKLIGYWIAEGSNHRAYIRFSLGNNEGDLAKEIQGIIKSLFNLETGIHRRQNGSKTGIELTCCHSYLANIFANLCGKGAGNKHIPFGFENLPSDKLTVLLGAIFKGDGHVDLIKQKKTRPGTKSITTISSILSFQLRDLLLKLGYEPGVYIQQEKRDEEGVNHKASYTVLWREDQKVHQTSFLENENGVRYWLLPIKEIKKYVSRERVYNFTVAIDHSYTTNNFIVSNCGKGGSVFNFLMEMEGMEFGEALRTLAKRAGVTLVTWRPTTGEAEKEKLYAINHLAGEFYHYLLVSHDAGKKALNYLLERGIKKESMKLFRLGYAPPLWEGLQKFLVGKRGYRVEDLAKLGLVARQTSTWRDFFRDRVIFPLKDHRGSIVGFAGRVVGAWQEEDSRRTGPKYINTPESQLYHKSELLYGLETTKNAIRQQNQAVIVEGELDLISSYQAGVENVVALKGSALTEAQGRLLKRFCENLVLALDTDLAGDQASRRGVRIADSLGFLIKVARVPEGKDPDELAQKNPDLWQKTVQEAIGVYDFLIDSAFSRYEGTSAEGKKKIGEEVVPLLAEMTDEIVKNHYLRLVATRLNVSQEAVLAQAAKLASTGQIKTKPVAEMEAPGAKSRQEVLEEYLFALVFQTQDEPILLTREVKKLILNPAHQKIIASLELFLKRKKKFTSQGFAQNLAPELLEIFNHFYLFDLGRKLDDERWRQQEKEKVLQELEEVSLREKIKLVSSEIKNLEKEGREKELGEAKKRFLTLSRQLGKVAF